MKFLLIDDSEEIISSVSLCLSLRWPQAEVFSANDGTTGLEMIERHKPDLVILDIELPDMSGLEVLRSLRGFSDVPVVMLTVRGQDVEIARFLEEGADDYMVKPFSHIEFMGRIQAICRRAQGRMQSIAPAVKAEDLFMDFGASEVYKANEPVALTRTEMSLLQYLVRNATRVVTYESLANVLQIAKDGDNRLIKVHIQHLRSKLGDSAENPRYIANVYAMGYKFLPRVTQVVTQALVSPL